MAARFETIAATSGDARRAANWVLGPLQASANATGIALEAHPLSAEMLGQLIRLEVDGKISNTAARQLFAMMETSEHQNAHPLKLAESAGLLKVSDDNALQTWIDEVIAEFPEESRRYLAGEMKLQGVLIGHIMRKSKGSADPKRLNQLLSARRAS